MVKEKEAVKPRVTVSLDHSLVKKLEELRLKNLIASSDNPQYVYNAILTYTYLIDQIIAGTEFTLHNKDGKELLFLPPDLMYSSILNSGE